MAPPSSQDACHHTGHIVTQAMKYRPDIDGLRAIAVLPVVFYHAGLPGFSGGFVGVDVFFVISGYLITGILWREIAQNDMSILRFYERRARRILPALLAVILFATIGAVFILTPEELSNFAASVIGSTFFVQNFVLHAQAGYFDAASETKPLLHIWSLAVEEQFYIFFPLALLAAARFMRRNGILILLALAAITSFGLSVWLVERSPAFNFYMLPPRAWELLAGSLLAIAGTTAVASPRARDVGSVLGLLAILLPVYLYSADTPFPSYTAAPAVLGASALIWAGPHSLVGRMLAWRPLVFIGLISYSLYLWHWPLIAFHSLVFPGEKQLTHGLILVGLSLVLATASWRFVEQPFRAGGKILSNRRSVFGVAAAGSAVCLSVSLLMLAGKGWPWRASGEVIAMANVAEQKQISDGQCVPEVMLYSLRGRERGFCRLGAPTDGAPDVIVWGDSHVGAWFPLLDQSFRKAGISAYAISMAGCPIAFGLDRADAGKEGCSQAASEVREYIETNAVKKVLVVGSWFGALEEKNTIYRGVQSHDAATRRTNVTRAIADTGDTLRALGVTSGFMMTVPGALHSLPEALFRQSQLGFHSEVRRTADNYRTIMGPIQAVAEQHYNLVVRTDDVLCASEFCDVVRDGEPLYFDSNHPSLYLNELMRPYLQDEIDEYAALPATVRMR